MERRAKFHTAPGRLRTYGTKRDVPAFWDLFDNPRDPRADSPSTVDDEGQQESHPPLLSSSWSSEGSELVIEGGGSWPRIRNATVMIATATDSMQPGIYQEIPIP